MHPNPNDLFPIPGSERTVFLKNIIKNPNIIVGDDTYYDDPDDIHSFEKNVLYHFDFIGDKLIMGTFCQIATHVKSIMNDGNPAEVIRKRFNDETIHFLLQLRWWEWPIEKIAENVLFFMNGDKSALEALIS